MKTKIKKLLFEYSKNSRITTKELGKKIKSSQQSASYLVNQLKKKHLIESVTMIDAIKLGFVNVLVGFNYLKINPTIKKEIIGELKENNSIIRIEEAKEGVDLLVEFSTPNLSAFHKIHSELIYMFDKRLKTTFVFPIIVRHEYLKNYLIKSPKISDTILLGDRDLKELSERETQLIHELVNNPDKKIINISESLKIPVKTLIKIKRNLEKRNIIKGYNAVLNNSKLGINRQIIFLRFSSGGIKEINKFRDFAKYSKNIIQFMKIIGEYHVVIIVESLKEIEEIKEIRSSFSIESYLIIKSEKISKKRYLPNTPPLKSKTNIFK